MCLLESTFSRSCNTNITMQNIAIKYHRLNDNHMNSKINIFQITDNCHFSNSSIGATDTGYKNVTQTEEDMAAAVATVGPISIGICVPDSFVDYKQGKF